MKKRLWLLILPFTLFYLGAALNLLVIACNHGTMPVVEPMGWTYIEPLRGVPGALTDIVHRVYDPHDIHLAFLCDWIFVPFLNGVVSPGDCFLWLGEWIKMYCIVGWFTLLIFQKESK